MSVYNNIIYRPCILFFDEFQAVFGRKESSGSITRQIVSQLLLELSELDYENNKSIIIIGATNCVDV